MMPQTEMNSTYSALGKENLWLIENSLKKYNKNIVDTLSKYYVKDSTVLDFGAGIGTLANIWSNELLQKPDCVEIDQEYISILQDRGYNSFSCINEIKKKYDFIYTSNVLEHIQDDNDAIRTLHSLLNEQGTIAIYVPAFMILFSSSDIAVNHFRRYGKRELIDKMNAANFEVTQCYYSDSVGFFAWLYRKYQRKQVTTLTQSDLLIYDRYIFPLSKFLDWIGLRFIFGKNLVLIARRRD